MVQSAFMSRSVRVFRSLFVTMLLKACSSVFSRWTSSCVVVHASVPLYRMLQSTATSTPATGGFMGVGRALCGREAPLCGRDTALCGREDDMDPPLRGNEAPGVPGVFSPALAHSSPCSSSLSASSTTTNSSSSSSSLASSCASSSFTTTSSSSPSTSAPSLLLAEAGRDPRADDRAERTDAAVADLSSDLLSSTARDPAEECRDTDPAADRRVVLSA
mmetsp:Transcript_22967/g.53628  ORF Transcript_22967/g.53628 Transcript_22967/m.53628 type:complete len:218 (+) Transcript_22967:2914-3567(+)